MTAVTHTLADFALDTTWKGLPAKVRTEAVRAFVNYIGCALGGAGTPIVETALRGIEGMGASGAIRVLGRAQQLDLINAAVVNCVSSAAHTYDDTHLKTITHPTGPVAAAILALGDARQLAGEDVLLALMLGIEIECRVSTAITARDAGSHGGWYITGVSGGIGAAAAAGRLLGLDHDRMVSALGLAATQSCGLRATHGSMAIAYVPGLAARNGLNAACMAHAGFTCSDIAIDGRNGLLDVMAPTADPAVITRDLGLGFEALNNTYKPYPCGIVIHPTIDACLDIASNHAPRADSIDKLQLEVHADALRLTWRKLPETALAAQVSLYHWAAAALVYGEAGLEQGGQGCVEDPRVRSLQERIEVTVSDRLADDQAVANLHMKDGSIYRAEVVHATGSVENPMTDMQLDAKFMRLAACALTDARMAEILTACRTVATLADVAEISRLGTSALRR